MSRQHLVVFSPDHHHLFSSLFLFTTTTTTTLSFALSSFSSLLFLPFHW